MLGAHGCRERLRAKLASCKSLDATRAVQTLTPLTALTVQAANAAAPSSCKQVPSALLRSKSLSVHHLLTSSLKAFSSFFPSLSFQGEDNHLERIIKAEIY